MSQLARALWAESLKLKRTLALWMAFVAPLVIVLLQFMMLWHRGAPLAKVRDGWELLSGGIYTLWAVLMLPLFITLETALLAGIEHSQKMWKHLFTLPVSRSVVYSAKLIVAAAMIAVSCFVLVIGTVTAGLLLRQLTPGALAQPVPWNDLLAKAAATFLASWLLIALHSWIALRWPSFALACGAGMAATVGTGLIAGSERWWKFYPWSLPFHALTSNHLQLSLTIGAFGGLLIAILGCWDVARRDTL